jgi:hypothetical protein
MFLLQLANMPHGAGGRRVDDLDDGELYRAKDEDNNCLLTGVFGGNMGQEKEIYKPHNRLLHFSTHLHPTPTTSLSATHHYKPPQLFSRRSNIHFPLWSPSL